MVKEILDLSASGYSAVQFIVTRCQNAEFQAGGHSDGLVPWVMKVLCAAASTEEGLSWLGDLRPISRVTEGGTAELDGSGSWSVHPSTS